MFLLVKVIVHFVHYGVYNRPEEWLICIIMDLFQTTCMLNDNVHPVRFRTVRNEETVGAVQESIEEEPNQ